MVGTLTGVLAARAEQLVLGEVLNVLDRLATEDMPSLYTTAAVLLRPCYNEGF